MSLERGNIEEETWQAQALLWNNIFSFINSMSLNCAVQLRIPEILHTNHPTPTTLADLAAAIPIPDHKADHLRRLMRLLVNAGIFAADEAGAYSLTPASTLLVPANGRMGMAAHVTMNLHPGIVELWHHYADWYKADGPVMPFDVAHGVSGWDYLRGQPGLLALFNDSMASDTELLMGAVITKCAGVFHGLRSLVDVGGGVGMAGKAIAKSFPGVKVTVLDLPHVVASLPVDGDDSGVEFVGGDMFKSIPSAHAVFLKWVLHDWTDEECVEILKKSKEAIPTREEGGKVIILEMVVDPSCPDEKVRETQFAYDMVMMASSMGKEREEREWKKIFQDAGFSDYKITPALGLRSVIELYP
uniref:COMTL5 n=1 Tax=Piper methysticum TaxID=130404 RepID=A0A4Y5QNM2_9MAGN|nr:COMTL5 [Piper methysticum]